METSDFLVLGGGIIGISIGRELKRRYAGARVTVLEKEPGCGLHASGRNSGVLHAGFYYSPDSLKAKLTRLGNRKLTAYCESRKIPLNKCGKLVVAADRSGHDRMKVLLDRAKANGIELHEVSEETARRIEPRVKTFERALFSPTTSTVNPGQVMAAMTRDAVLEGVDIRCGVRYLSGSREGVHTSAGGVTAGYVVNAAGLYADRIAKEYGFSEHYRILPFKGLYLHSDEPAGAIRTNIYPVPDLERPFLGVHFTVMADGHVKVGPTAIPALWREQYEGFGRFKWSEVFEVMRRTFGLVVSSRFDFLRLAAHELPKCFRSRMVKLAAGLADGVTAEHYRRWGHPGIRAQLVDITKGKLEMDFVIEGDHRSMHVLNAVSPGFTCALPFAELVCDRIALQLD